MMLRNSAAIVILAAACAWGQSPAASRRVVPTSNTEGVAAGNRARIAANQNLQEMGATITKMEGLLKHMSAHATSAKDPSAKANI